MKEIGERKDREKSAEIQYRLNNIINHVFSEPIYPIKPISGSLFVVWNMNSSVIQEKIFEIRGEKVMLDFDLASLYGVETKALNQAVKRNIERFPGDFMFQLTENEYKNLKSQIVTSSWGGVRKLPFAFTEHGVTMLAGVLRSEKAILTNILIVRAFISLRHIALQYKELAEKLSQLEASNKKQFREIYTALNFLIAKKQKEEDFSKRQRIGFNR
jgi:hypothetical protein